MTDARTSRAAEMTMNDLRAVQADIRRSFLTLRRIVNGLEDAAGADTPEGGGVPEVAPPPVPQAIIVGELAGPRWAVALAEALGVRADAVKKDFA